MTPELLAALNFKPSPDATLRFSVATVQGKKGYCWGQVATSDEPTARAIATIWNSRHVLASLALPTPDKAEAA